MAEVDVSGGWSRCEWQRLELNGDATTGSDSTSMTVAAHLGTT
jgi:hypothetical protein